MHFWGGPPLREGAGGEGAAPLWPCGNIAFWGPDGDFLCVFQHSGKVVVQCPRDSHLSDLSQVTLQVPLGSCTGNFKKGRHWHKAAPHAGDGAKVTSSRGGFNGLRPLPLAPEPTQKTKNLKTQKA